MKTDIAFGIGCFHFGINKKAPFNITGKEYIDRLQTKLKSVANIDKVKIEADEEFIEHKFSIRNHLPSLQKGEGFFPHPLFLYISFEVYIPFKIQAKIIKTEQNLLDTHTERFKTHILYGYHSPVAFIELLNPSKTPSPSTAVMIIRDFLKKTINNSKKKRDIKFEILGPSPFHVDCYLKAKGEYRFQEGQKFMVQSEEIRSYHQIFFNYNLKFFTKNELAFKRLIEIAFHEFDFFYGVQQEEVTKMHRWEKIGNLIKQLMSIERKNWFNGFFEKISKRSNIIGELFIGLTDFQSYEIFLEDQNREHYSDLYVKNEEKYFQSYIDRQLKEKRHYPLKEIIELINFFENRNDRNLQILYLVFSAIIGGIVGGFLAKL